MVKVYFSKDIDKLIERIDFSKLGNKVGIKVHFGEKGCITYIKPELVRLVYDKVVASGREASLIECNVLYRGERTRASSHIALAKEHGFGFAKIDILDGELGDEFVEVDLEKGFVSPVKIGKGIENYDSMIVLTHFKGHEASGFGGAFKNIGMGLGSRAGKLQMHSDLLPYVNQSQCIGCNDCVEHCDFKAIEMINGKAKIDDAKCAGCAMCVAVCCNGAVRIPWGSSTANELQEKIVDYADGVMKLISKDKMIFINVLEDITDRCDCMGIKMEPMMEDVGILMGEDIVAVDKASLDLVNLKSKGKFDKINSIDKNVQIDYGEEKGLGSKEYDLISL